jgi:hypothetical protein
MSRYLNPYKKGLIKKLEGGFSSFTSDLMFNLFGQNNFL